MRLLPAFLIGLSFSGLCLYGILFVHSSTLSAGLGEGTPLELSPNAQKQVMFFLLGGVAMFGLSRIPYDKWAAYTPYFYLLNILILIMVLASGSVRGGARSWFIVLGFGYQPSETMKIAWILYMSWYLRQKDKIRSLEGLVYPLLITLVPVLLIFIQPDLGTASIFIPSLFLTLYLAGAKKRHLFSLFVAMLVLIYPLSFFLKPYQIGRIMAFLDPRSFEKTYAYSLNNSLLAIGDGHWLGKGLGAGEVNRLNLLPECHTDFIFSVIAEELGFVGAVGLILCFGLLIVALLVLASYTRELFGKTLVLGLCSILAVQSILNMGVALGILPTTGVTLPFISAGGSSVITSCAMLGIALSVAFHHVPVLSREEFQS
ncbi:MAG: rod shape-determining protein RodA [Planctomycetes bacterium]|nr:rod shape-determining protein RodA [Planctomycetota bacterium]